MALHYLYALPARAAELSNVYIYNFMALNSEVAWMKSEIFSSLRLRMVQLLEHDVYRMMPSTSIMFLSPLLLPSLSGPFELVQARSLGIDKSRNECKLRQTALTGNEVTLHLHPQK